MDWKGTVTAVSENVFPGISKKIDEELYGYEVMSNLPLQMSLYFNVIFAPLWCILIILFLNENFQLYTELYKFIIITIIVTIFAIEVLRLYLGYEGNLKDKVPELAGFWMLSVLLQFPLQMFLLLNPFFGLNVVEVVAQGLMCLLLCLQLIFGYLALKYTALQQAAYFRIMKCKNLDTFKYKVS
ncbi:transmembrane protein 17-like [Aethina tumida]|uniref:transmembrane protein 17-like n=1 Tax=Aethina tumida TaxID=116153 RepID=UPI00096B5299|nr:transmembrane protein 17-like [Aethina tumida]